MTKLAKTDFLTILAEELQGTVEADVRITKKLAGEVLAAVEGAYARALIEEQQNVGLGSLGQFKVEVKPERTHRNPQNGAEIVKPKHLAAKFVFSKPFRTELAETEFAQ